MTIMIPSVISPEVKSTAERRIFEWFKTAPDTDDWIVLHSLGISTHNKVIYGETDFLVLAPHFGMFALEVKGGRVRREQGIWYFTDRYDRTTSKARGPFEQAKDGIFSITDAIKKRLDESHENIGQILFGYGVMFPDIEYLSSGIDEEQWQVFDHRDGASVRRFIERLSNGAKAKWEAVYGPLGNSKLPTISDVKYIASILRGDFDFTVSMNVQLQHAQKALISLTHEQYRCLDQLDDNPRCLIRGAAGTGKTLLAIEEAKKSVARGERVALFCFNANLADWLDNYFKDQPLSLRPEFVGTLHKYMTQVARNAGLLPAFPTDKNEVQTYYQKTLPFVAATILEETSNPFDKIIIDEAQDLIRDSYLRVLNACLRKGLERGRWTMFGDFSMQAIYSDGVTGDLLIEQLDDIASFARFKLTINCRNTKPICTEIETVTGFKAPNDLWSKVDGPPVQYITWSTTEEQSRKLELLLTQLQDSNIPPEQITILSPRKKDSSIVSVLDGHTVREFKVPHEKDIAFSTIQAYKGLENTVIIITDIETFSEEKLMYIGLSRATSGLFVLESEAAKIEYDNLWIRRFLK